jgi:purine-binding chemotaxis protein CheW
VRAVLVQVGTNWFALPIGSLREVVADPPVTPLPTAPPTVRGLVNVRGQIVPLLDTAALLGLGHMAAVPFAAVLDTPLGPAGLAAASMPEPAELTERVGSATTSGAVGAFAAGQRVAVLLDPVALLAQVA